jgi:hypothetical protein
VISIEEYFGGKINRPDATPERKANAEVLLRQVNALIDEARTFGIRVQNDPDTGTQISGSKGGAGDGGFRLSTAATGRPGSAHKEGMAVDVFDPGNRLDEWITRDILVKYGLYREAKQWTEGWCHLTTRPPRSLTRSYNP